MTQIVSIHSYRGGTGKSNTTANLAALVARQGKRVGIVDTDINSPGIHVIFGMDDAAIGKTLNDYLWGNCPIEEAAYEIDLPDTSGTVFLIPSSPKTGEITRVLREGYEVGMLIDGLRELNTALDLDVLLIDTHPGLNDETLLSITISDVLIIVLRPDNQDYQGTGVTVEVARKLDVPALYLLLNKVPAAFDAEDVKHTVEQTYGATVPAVLPHADEMMVLSSAGIFAVEFPHHPLTRELEKLASLLG
jgi:MinD-like ATPase involved in chromosome partitioning or flagellar assembly